VFSSLGEEEECLEGGRGGGVFGGREVSNKSVKWPDSDKPKYSKL